ncbi:unnamed protein product [Trifolium pratense]|uniref:Uncharacterized protein n=2 Tax=Trifolium pratense TaxID=57577 RepID=A0ACB0L6D2_TRIPR|nr:unnamed protein product [Trifolium pratense]
MIGFWKEKWCGAVPFRQLFPNLFVKESDQNVVVAERLVGTNINRHWQWAWSCDLTTIEEEELQVLQQILLDVVLVAETEDNWRWIPDKAVGLFSIKTAYSSFLNGRGMHDLNPGVLPALKSLWENDIPTRAALASRVDDTQTLLSAVITNHQTCLDGLMTVANSNLTIKNDLISQLSNDNKLHSVSLGLFTKGWMHEKKNKTLWNSRGWHSSNFRNGRLPLKMSNRTRAIYDSSRGRGKKHDDDYDGDDDEGGVLVRDIVVVSKDGSENFTTINDAVAAAPNNTINATNGYFLIFIKEGIYEEYVSIPQNKAYLMMIGDGINKTVIK